MTGIDRIPVDALDAVRLEILAGPHRVLVVETGGLAFRIPEDQDGFPATWARLRTLQGWPEARAEAALAQAEPGTIDLIG